MRRSLLFIVLVSLVLAASCRQRNSEFVTVALSEKFTTLDTLTSTSSDVAAERVRNLMFNALVKKNENFEYVGELAKEIRTSDDGKTLTFVLQSGVKFHNGKEFTSADVKYTFDELFKANGFKAGAFFDTVPDDKPAPAPAKPAENSNAAANTPAQPKTKRMPHITSLTTPDPQTVVITVGRSALAHQLLSNLVAIPIIAEGTIGQQKDSPIGTGPFKFVGRYR